MSKKCRILSICVSSVVLVILIVACAIIVNKNKNKYIYARYVQFSTQAGQIELHIDSELLIHNDMVKITPSNCTYVPIFKIKKMGEDEEKVITSNKLTFQDTGNYTLYCYLKSSKTNFVKTSLVIKVVDVVTDSISLNIKTKDFDTPHIDDEILLTDIATLKYPNKTKVYLKHSEHIEYANNIIKAVKPGIATIDIYLDYENIIITKRIIKEIKPKVIEEDVGLKLSIDGIVLEDNHIELEYSQFVSVINYEIVNARENQTINCWTESSNIEIVSFNAPAIKIKTLSLGEAEINVSSVDYPHIVFKIFISIV